MQSRLAPAPCPAPMVAAYQVDAETAMAAVSDRVAELLRPVRMVPRYSDHGFEGDTEIWKPRAVMPADVPALERQLSLVEQAMAPGDPGFILARVHALLAQYRDHSPLPSQVEAAIAEDWLDDLGEFPAHVVAEACRQWRRHPVKYRFKPLPGDIRTLCVELSGRLPIIAGRLRKLLASARTAQLEAPVPTRVADIRARVVALAAAQRML